MPLKTIKQNQADWAVRSGLSIDEDGYCAAINENLFRPLSALTRAELAEGDGDELGRDGARGKAQALHSSSTLACNFFDYWRGRDLSSLASVFGTGELCGLRFEAKFPTGLRGKSPNLDVLLYERDGGIVAIESKFTEPFAVSRRPRVFKDAYFARPDVWESKGLAGCQALAGELRYNPSRFRALDAPQLLKHMLGLASSGQPWRLCCLWYRPDGELGDLHAAELEAFASRIGADATRFVSMTYQEAFRALKSVSGKEHEPYIAYLQQRYFPST